MQQDRLESYSGSNEILEEFMQTSQLNLHNNVTIMKTAVCSKYLSGT